MKIVFIADFFAEEVSGGGELNNEELIQILSAQDHEILKIKSYVCGKEAFDHFKQMDYIHFLIGNFINLCESA